MIDGPSFALGLFLMALLWAFRYAIATYGDKK